MRDSCRRPEHKTCADHSYWPDVGKRVWICSHCGTEGPWGWVMGGVLSLFRAAVARLVGWLRSPEAGLEVLRNGSWRAASERVWRAFPGRRRCRRGFFGTVEYHGPCGVGRVSRERRECRCRTCTMFEPGAEHPPSAQRAVDFMLEQTWDP